MPNFVRITLLSLLLVSVAKPQRISFPDLKNKPLISPINSQTYVFSPLSPGGSLSPGTNTITLRPVPLGINGNDVEHRVWISGGSGTAEACLITGGTATSGLKPSGTLVISCANSHSGAWTIQTATSGIQEALATLPAGGGVVYVPDTYGCTLNGTLTVSLSFVTIAGGGIGNATNCTDATGATTTAIRVTSSGGVLSGVKFQNFQLTASGKTAGNGIYCTEVNNFTATNIVVINEVTGLNIDGTDTYLVTVKDSIFNTNITTAGTQLRFSGVGGLTVQDTNMDGAGTGSMIGIALLNGGGPVLTNVDILRMNIGLAITPGNGQSVVWLFTNALQVDTGNGYGIYISPTGNGVVGGAFFNHSWSSSNALDGAIINAGTGTVDGVHFMDHRSLNNGNNGYNVLAAINTTFDDSFACGNSTVGAGSYNGLTVATNVSKLFVHGGIYGLCMGLPGTQNNGIVIAGGAGNTIEVTNVNLLGNVASTLSDGATGTTKIVKDNFGVGIPTLASSATINPGTADPEAINLTGTTNVTSIARPWDLRRISFIKNDAGNLKIYGATLVQGSKIDCLYSSGIASWFCTNILVNLNYIATENGSNNAIASPAGGPDLATGLTITVDLAHTLQAGANTFAYNGGAALDIKSHFNVSNNIAAAYAATGFITLVYDGTRWLDLSQ